MRDAFGFNFSKDESKEADEDTKFKGIHVSSNGYYGYQLVQSNEKTNDDNYEFMEVQCNDDSDIQFNNFIRPEERLCSEPVVMRESAKRKRPLNYDITTSCKKRREDAPIPELPSTYKYLNSRQPTHNVPDMPRNLMGHFI